MGKVMKVIVEFVFNAFFLGGMIWLLFQFQQALSF